MAEVEIPPKEQMDALTDEALAGVAASRAGFAAEGGEGYLMLRAGDAIARTLNAQFPGVPERGRIVMAAAQALMGIEAGFARKGGGIHSSMLTAIAALAGEQLDREATDRRMGVTLDDEVSVLWGTARGKPCSTRTGSWARNALVSLGVLTVRDLTRRTRADLRDGRVSLGTACVAEVRRVLAEHGLALKGEEAADAGASADA